MMDPIHDTIAPFIQDQSILGASVAILQDGAVTFTGGFGVTSTASNGVPVAADTLFAFGSICKNICAALIMRLVERDMLDLDAPILNYLPSLRFSDPLKGSRVTLRHLLSHTSGLPMAGKYWGPRHPDSLRRFVYEQIPFYTFLSEPGAVHHYSNTVICIAGHIAEAVTGKYYDDLVQEYIFDPLRMATVTYDPAVAMTYPLALPHQAGPDGVLQVRHRMTYNVSGNPSSFAYGGVKDLANLAAMYLNDGLFEGQPFLSASTIAGMQRPHASRHIRAAAHPIACTYTGHGLGFYTGEYEGRIVARHGGMNLSYNCFFDLFPQDRAAVILLTNYSQEDPIINLVTALYDIALKRPRRGVVFIEKPAPVPDDLQDTDLHQYAGTFIHIESGRLAEFRCSDQKLTLDWQDSTEPLVHFDNDRFYLELGGNVRIPIAFLRAGSGEIIAVMVAGNPYYPLTLDPEPGIGKSGWPDCVGMYKDPSNTNDREIFSVYLQDGQLWIAEGDQASACHEIGKGVFRSDLGVIEFVDTQLADIKILVWGKATPYYPVDEEAYRSRRKIEFLIGVPFEPPRNLLHPTDAD